MNQHIEELYRTLEKSQNKGTLFILDGASCSGKTSIRNDVLQDKSLNLEYVPRYCTRSVREGEIPGEEYIFLTQKDFDTLEKSGDLIESRHFEFGMSYGLPWKETIQTLIQGKNALAIINLGNILKIKQVLPHAVTILIDAPEEIIKNRLLRRGVNTKEQIEERLFNARTVHELRKYYHYVINNNDGLYECSIQFFREIVEANSRKCLRIQSLVENDS